MLPSSKYLPRLTAVSGFDPLDAVVELTAGYMVWTALTASGRGFVCGTGFDGYAGTLEETVGHGGWALQKQVRSPSACSAGAQFVLRSAKAPRISVPFKSWYGMLLGSSCAALGEMPSRQGVDCAGTATQDRLSLIHIPSPRD